MDILPEAASEFLTPPHPSPPTPQRNWRQLKGMVSVNLSFENTDNQ